MSTFERPYCTCKEDNDFCDICLQVALDEFVKQGKLERKTVNGEHDKDDESKYIRICVDCLTLAITVKDFGWVEK